MSKTFNTHPFDVHAQERDVVTLRDYSADNALISYKRTAPKRTKDFVGMEKSEVKHSLLGADGSIIGIVSVSTSIRADATLPDRTDLIDTHKAIVADSAFSSLVIDQKLPFIV